MVKWDYFELAAFSGVSLKTLLLVVTIANPRRLNTQHLRDARRHSLSVGSVFYCRLEVIVKRPVFGI